MFVLSRNVSASFRVIATLVATAVVMWTLGVSHFAQAANITDVYDLLSDSAPGAVANHTIEFVTPTGVPTGQSIVITFPAAFTGIAGIDTNDVDLLIDGVAEDIAGGDWTVTTNATSITLANVSGTDPVGATTTILVGLHADNEGVPDEQITNPASPAGGNESYEIDISAGTSDTGHTRVVILNTVLVTAEVATTFTFEVEGNGGSEPVNGETTDLVSSSTTIPFGQLDAGVPVVLSQDLIVNTNAIHGFVVTVEEDQHLESSTGADIDNFANNNNSVTPAVWGTLAADIDDENTWGHWGITTEDATTTRTAEFGTNQWLGVSTTPTVIFSHDGPADGVTAGIGSTTVGYKVEITALQEAADDYTTTLTYIATPTF